MCQVNKHVPKLMHITEMRCTSTVAFDADENVIEKGSQKDVVVGEILEQLLFEESVESKALHFYIHRRKLSSLKDHAKFDGHKYLNCAYMDPSAWLYVDKKWHDKNRLVDKFIVDMADNLDRLLIPMNNIGEKFDGGKH
ncbi:hypothetical protein C5167_021196 [Papaver somniferum]|uniref:Uncharacterized protein n=1 Tax=Papaver somniferum TaxID=3469 RepID=A0A4Y7IV85_PAPSO|nr:hypothetical protein C5167_021196 [Papaver somniferum]